MVKNLKDMLRKGVKEMKEQITVFSVVYNGYGRFIPQ